MLHYFEINYAVFEKTWDFSGLVDQYNRSLVNRDREVRVFFLCEQHTYDMQFFLDGFRDPAKFFIKIGKLLIR